MDSFLKSLIVTLIGLVVVFVILIILFFFCKMFGLIGNDKKTRHQGSKKTVVPSVPVPNIKKVSKADDAELIAVITAAVAACMSIGANVPVTPNGITIRSIKRLTGDRSSWRNAGRAQQIQSRF